MELVPIAEVPPIFYKDSANLPIVQANGKIKKGFGRIQILFFVIPAGFKPTTF